ncbi:MAG: hypothetical protein KDA17_07575 [Candidatus Saccharibacteria bacterium]|nr:hypothetical protein [Candidatus Saccharibacteria bacterium]
MNTQIRTREEIEDRTQRVNDLLYIILVGYGTWVALWFGTSRLIIHYHHQAILAGEPASLSNNAIMGIFFIIGALSGAGAVWVPLRDFLVEKRLLEGCIALMNQEDNLKELLRQNK